MISYLRAFGYAIQSENWFQHYGNNKHVYAKDRMDCWKKWRERTTEMGAVPRGEVNGYQWNDLFCYPCGFKQNQPRIAMATEILFS